MIHKRFEPHILAVPAGSVVWFPNLDPFFHNVFSLFDGNRFDLGLYEAGASFTTRLTELRLRKAADLLTRAGGGGGRISDIAFDCGFNDLSYFNRCFRRRFGLTPSAARGR